MSFLTDYDFIPENAADAARAARKVPLVIPSTEEMGPLDDEVFDGRRYISAEEKTRLQEELSRSWPSPVRLKPRQGGMLLPKRPQVNAEHSSVTSTPAPAKPSGFKRRGAILQNVAAQPPIIPTERVTYYTMDDYKLNASEGVALPTAPVPAAVTNLLAGWQVAANNQVAQKQETWVALTAGDDRLPWTVSTTMWRGVTASLDIAELPATSANVPFVFASGRILNFKGTLTSFPLAGSGDLETYTTTQEIVCKVNAFETGTKVISSGGPNTLTLTIASNNNLALSSYAPSVRYFQLALDANTDRDRYHVLSGVMQQLQLPNGAPP